MPAFSAAAAYAPRFATGAYVHVLQEITSQYFASGMTHARYYNYQINYDFCPSEMELSSRFGAAAAYCRGCLLFIVKIFLCGIFMMWGGNRRGHTSPHTLVMLEVCRHTFGWER
jgi:hypothetical protein